MDHGDILAILTQSQTKGNEKKIKQRLKQWDRNQQFSGSLVLPRY